MADTMTTGTPGTPSTVVHKLAAEAVGTFVLVLLGCGTAVMTNELVPTALAFGIAIIVMVYAFGRVSGGHFNPAVTLGAAISGRTAWRELPLYVGAQLLGAVLAGLVLLILFQGVPTYDSPGPMGQNFFGEESANQYAWWAALLLEALLTLVFVYVILAVTDERNEHPALAPLAIGLTLAAIHFFAIPATGTSVNPARSIGPALFAGADAILQLWLFILAPLAGAAIAGLTYPLLFGRGADPVPGSGIRFGGRAAAVPGYGAPDQLQQQWNQQHGDQQQGWPTQTTPMTQQPGLSGTSAEAGETQVKQNFADQPVIIRDGWQWDYQAQQWKPAQQQQPPSPQG